jgi:hypothetical protein
MGSVLPMIDLTEEVEILDQGAKEGLFILPFVCSH